MTDKQFLNIMNWCLSLSAIFTTILLGLGVVCMVKNVLIGEI